MRARARFPVRALSGVSKVETMSPSSTSPSRSIPSKSACSIDMMPAAVDTIAHARAYTRTLTRAKGGCDLAGGHGLKYRLEAIVRARVRACTGARAF
eukprot:3749801-Pleurochrysis_carterae.AAC.1